MSGSQAIFHRTGSFNDTFVGGKEFSLKDRYIKISFCTFL